MARPWRGGPVIGGDWRVAVASGGPAVRVVTQNAVKTRERPHNRARGTAALPLSYSYFYYILEGRKEGKEDAHFVRVVIVVIVVGFTCLTGE